MNKKNPELPYFFDLDEFVDLLGLRTEEKIAAAEIRLKYTYEILCCDCVENRKTSASYSNENPLIKFFKINVFNKNPNQKENYNNNDNSNLNDACTQFIHLICAHCVDRHKSELDSEKNKHNKQNNNNDNNNTNANSNQNKNLNNTAIKNLNEFDFLCGICNKMHFTSVKLDENQKNKNACCAGGCSIF